MKRALLVQEDWVECFGRGCVVYNTYCAMGALKYVILMANSFLIIYKFHITKIYIIY
jgi:hypothetical protein